MNSGKQDMNAEGSTFKSGFVAIFGAPNAGKSTLLNRILGEKISITSRKPQTTRNVILGVLHRPLSQMVFRDTPGVYRAKGLLNQRIVSAALSAIEAVDAILYLSDALVAPDTESEMFLLDALQKVGKPAVLAINKIDLIRRRDIAAVIAGRQHRYPFKNVFPISAKHATGISEMLNGLESLLPVGPPLFPEDTITDAPLRFLAAEIVREKIIRLTGQEIPYAIAVTIDSFSDSPGEDIANIHASIHVERDSQRGVVIGGGGEKLKQIGTQARLDIERLLGKKVFLHLLVKVQRNWRRDQYALNRLGYR
jgi:GTP-binding protein Era